jgi:enolase
VPQGKSTGSHEAVSLPASKVIEYSFKHISDLLNGKGISDQEYIDEVLCEAAGENKANLGANATLAVSIAVARAQARVAGIPLWKYLRSLSNIDSFETPFPRPFVNLINGGAHTGNIKIFQEYILIPQEGTMRDCLEHADRAWRVVGEEVNKNREVSLGDEGGYALKTEDPIEPLEILSRTVGEYSKFAIDAAATESVYDDDHLTDIYKIIIGRFPVEYLEDPYGEEDFDLFSRLQNTSKVICVGDDLTTTNVSRMERAFNEKSIRGIIIKPNQIGTVTETLSAARLARLYGWHIIVSHRSGETEDTFIADLAYGVGAEGIKIGASVHKERLAKYDRLRVIEREIAILQ